MADLDKEVKEIEDKKDEIKKVEKELEEVKKLTANEKAKEAAREKESLK